MKKKKLFELSWFQAVKGGNKFYVSVQLHPYEPEPWPKWQEIQESATGDSPVGGDQEIFS